LNTSFRRVLAHLTPDDSHARARSGRLESGPAHPIWRHRVRAGGLGLAGAASGDGALPQPAGIQTGRVATVALATDSQSVSQFWKTGGPRRVVAGRGSFRGRVVSAGHSACSGSRCLTTSRGMVSTPRSSSCWVVSATYSAVWNPDRRFPGGCGLFSLLLTLTGIALVGLLYGLITEHLLSMQFQFLQRRPPVPKQNHIVIVGQGGVGRRVAGILHQLHSAAWSSSPTRAGPLISSPDIPVVQGKNRRRPEPSSI
jgi:hypothetical protein